MHLRGTYRDEFEPFFVFRDKSPVKPQQFRDLLRSLLESISLDSSLYDVHSFRGGRTVDLYKFGYSIDQIKTMGRWKSNAVYRYKVLKKIYGTDRSQRDIGNVSHIVTDVQYNLISLK